ncbi:MAG: hypothetical protein CXZ00_15515 [Acidobacteria bacterium]|nr:MAG: hypothetical protein CXZ00_15515 [Acidobacteriota bacterium]
MESVACKQTLETTGERGQALLELMPVMVLLLTLTCAVLDFSRALWQVQVITGLTREGSNLASRNTSLADSTTAVVNDGAVLKLTTATNGKVIITSVQNVNGNFVITGQYSVGNLSANSRVGMFSGNKKATLPATATTIPQPGDTVYVTEIFSSFSPITPLGTFVKNAIPLTLYDVAYF